VSAIDAVFVCLLAGAAALTQGLSGFGFALFIVPPLAMVVGAREAVVLSNLLGTGVNVITLVRARGHVEWRLGLTLLAGAAAGMPAGLAVLLLVDGHVLQVLIAFVVFAATLIRAPAVRQGGRIALRLATGFVSGVLNTSTSMSGPPVVLFLQSMGASPAAFRATLAAYFLAGGLIAVLIFALAGRIDGPGLGYTALAAPALLAGWAAGNLGFVRLDPARFRLVVLVVLRISALVALVTALVALAD
jgi:uncharacterized membrane protein YfcA